VDVLFVNRDSSAKPYQGLAPARVRECLQRLVHVPFEQSGSRVVLYQPNGLQ